MCRHASTGSWNRPWRPSWAEGCLDPASKSFAIASGGMSRSLARARAEVAECVFLCANCHAEVEAGLRQLPSSGFPPRLEADGPG